MLLRRVHKSRVKLGAALPVRPSAFDPTPGDTDGLSFFRERFCDVPGALKGARKPEENYVVCLPVAAILKHGLSLVLDKIDEAPGHVLLPEITFALFETDKTKWLMAQTEWAELSSANIVHHATCVQVPSGSGSPPAVS
jgi:hypothetical protein